tara:strand:+ start:33 stop:203 length:171 start_codon:yes stop_codon:yes gene_type:complete
VVDEIREKKITKATSSRSTCQNKGTSEEKEEYSNQETDQMGSFQNMVKHRIVEILK